jgi:hypothetical protein
VGTALVEMINVRIDPIAASISGNQFGFCVLIA